VAANKNRRHSAGELCLVLCGIAFSAFCEPCTTCAEHFLVFEGWGYCGRPAVIEFSASERFSKKMRFGEPSR
jgi:hypothetical protein